MHNFSGLSLNSIIMFPPSSQKRPKFNQKLEQYQTCFKKISGGTLKLTFLGHQNASIILIPKIFSERGLSPLSPPPKLARASETCKIYLFISHVLGKKYDHEKRGGAKISFSKIIYTPVSNQSWEDM